MDAPKYPPPRRPHECKVCGKTFKHRSSMPVHMRKHTGERPYKCSKCNKDFIYLSSYSIHMVSAHKSNEASAGGRYRCNVCNRSFSSPLALKCHMRYHDASQTIDENTRKKTNTPQTSRQEKNDESPSRLYIYKCMYCTERFRYRDVMLAHERTHAQLTSGVMCKECGKSFKSNLHLKYHVATCKHMHACQECGKKYHHQYKLDMHMRLSHGATTVKSKGEIEALTCKICGNQYRNRCNLKLHLRTHTGERPYTCLTCGQSFTQRHHLKGHRHVHEKTPDKQYECRDCKAYFKQEYNLKQHMMRLHPEKYDAFLKKLESDEFTIKHEGDDNNEHEAGDTAEEIPQEHFCDICGRSFPKRQELMQHIERHIRNPDEIGKSELAKKVETGSSNGASDVITWATGGYNSCKQFFVNRRMASKKILEKFYVPRTNLFPVKRDPMSGKALFVCKICKMTFTLKENFVRHIVRRAYDHGIYLKRRPPHLMKPSILPNKAKDPNFTSHNYKCDVCGFAYLRQYNMLIHRKEHTEEEFRMAGVKPDKFDHIKDDMALVAGDNDLPGDDPRRSSSSATKVREKDHQDYQVYVDHDEMDAGQISHTDATESTEMSTEQVDIEAADSNAANLDISELDTDNHSDTVAEASVTAEIDVDKSDNIDQSRRQKALSTSTSEKANPLCPSCKLPFLEKQRTIQCHLCGFDYCIECCKVSRDVLDNFEAGADAPGVVWMCSVCCPLLPKLGGLLGQLGDFEFAVQNKLTDLEKKLSAMEKSRNYSN